MKHKIPANNLIDVIIKPQIQHSCKIIKPTQQSCIKMKNIDHNGNKI